MRSSSADFILQGTLRERGSHRIKPMIEKACLGDFSGTWAGEGSVLKPYEIHFMSAIFL